MYERHDILTLAEEPFFKRSAKGEKHPYGSMSREDVKKWQDSYLNKHQQPYHKTVKRLESMFRNTLGGASVFSKEGWDKIIHNDSLLNQYVETVANDFYGSSESWKTAYKNTVMNSVEGMRTDPMGVENFPTYANQMKSAEGVASMATYQNRDNFSNMTAFGIAGWFGRSKILELYHPIENNTMPEFSYKFILEYAIHPVTKKELPLPLAWRDDSLYGVFDLPQVKPLFVSEALTPQLMDKATKVTVIDSIDDKGTVKTKEVELGDGWVKTGATSNLLVDSADGSNDFSSDNALEPTVAIDEILYIADYKDANTPIYKKKKVNIISHEAAGQQNIFRFWAVLKFKGIKYWDATEGKAKEYEGEYQEKVYGDVDLDKGDFAATSKSEDVKMNKIIVAFKPYALISDNGNTRPGVEHQTRRFVNTLRLEYTNFGHIPLTPYTLDNYNLGNDSLGYVATMTDYMTKTYTISRDAKAEHHLMNDMERPKDMFPLYVKLGGFEKQFKHNFALTGPIITEDPYKQSRFALRERIFRGLSYSETELYIPQTVARGWVLFGPDIIVQAFADISNSNQKPDAAIEKPVNSGGTRFGFNIDEAASIIDEVGRAVKIIGCTDQRWQGRNIMGGMKSMDMNYPTFLYYAYMFRIFTGIDPQYRNLSAVLFYGRDGFFTMLKAHVEVIISNYDESLYETAMTSAKTIYTVQG